MPISLKYEYAFKCKYSSISNKENITKEYLELATSLFSNCDISNFPNRRDIIDSYWFRNTA